ncbi:CsgG/HfaB family protein [Sporomusa malonica]|uniref:Curli production assembly/transport component CsgG n=1 Tax=Sporomusa malonica TaxID=112901 RepID=A0A1W2E6T2_9FIRM|nr:CsgG/HfaB family protein [Sporomusa malonica]SMD05451.1 Curli production assembly/transport component CsgG [Sporomusa malonica]
MKVIKGKVWLCFLVAIIACGWMESVVSADVGDKLRVGVVEFDVKGDLDIKDAGAIIAEWMITALGEEGRFELKAREVLLKKVLQEQSLGLTGIIDNETAVGIGRIYGVQAVVTGSVTKWGKTIKVDARLVDTINGSVMRVASIEVANADDIPKQIRILASKIATERNESTKPGTLNSVRDQQRSQIKYLGDRVYHVLDITSHCNWRMRNMGYLVAEQMPEGDILLGGVPFYIGTEKNNIWASSRAVGPNAQVLEIPMDIPNPVMVYTLINSEWGKLGGESLAYIEFFGSSGAYYKKELTGNEDIRDWLKGTGWFPKWAQNINNKTTINVVTVKDKANEARLDRQQISLPSTFHGQNLVKVRLVDNGEMYVQKIFLTGITILVQ